MTDYTQLLYESESLCELYEALQASQRERDELAAAIWGELQSGMTTEETCRQAVDQRVAFDAIDAVKAERDRLRAERDRLRAKLTCPECGQEIHAAHHLECSHDRS